MNTGEDSVPSDSKGASTTAASVRAAKRAHPLLDTCAASSGSLFRRVAR